MKKLAIAMMALALGVCGARAGSWSVGANAGYTLGGDVEDSSFAPGVQATWQINETWALELGVFQFSDEGGETEEGVVWSSEVEATPLTATLLASLPSPKHGGAMRAWAPRITCSMWTAARV